MTEVAAWTRLALWVTAVSAAAARLSTTWWLFLCASTLRLWFVLSVHPPGDFVFSDMSVFDNRALNLRSGSFTLWDTFTPPGYPALLVVLYEISDRSRTFVGVVQAILGGATAALSHRIAIRIGTPGLLAAVAGLCVAAHVPLVLYAGLILSETTFAFLLALSTWLLMRTVDRPAFRNAAFAGLALGAGIAVRPNLLPFMALLPVFVWFSLGGDRQKALKVTMTVLVGVALPLVAMSAHVSRVAGQPAFLPTNGGLNFYLNFAEVRLVTYVAEGNDHTIAPLPNMARYQQDSVTRVPLYDERYFYRRGVRLIVDQPRRLVRALDNFVEGAGAGKQDYWPGWPEHDEMLQRYSRWFFALAVLPASLHLVWILFVRRLRDPDDAPRVLLAYLCASCLIALYFFLGDPRVRVPYDPLLIILALDGARRAAAAGYAAYLQTATDNPPTHSTP